MKMLGLLRHAKSDWSDGNLDDFDRPLNARGWAAAEAMGPTVRECEFDRVLASTAKRVRETVAGTGLDHVEWRDEIYGAAPDTLLALGAKVPDSVERLLIVGHNPTMHSLANMLARSGEEEQLGALAEKYPTAAFSLFRLPIDRWEELGTARGELDRFVRPADL